MLGSDGRLEFVACWSHARRKVEQATTYQKEAEQLLAILLEELPVKLAAKLTARITGLNKRDLYDRALQLKTQRNG